MDTVLIYLGTESFHVVRDEFVTSRQLIKGLLEAKQLGFRGLVPETDCADDCRYCDLAARMKLREGSMELLPPLPLTFAEGMLELKYDLDLNYHVAHGSELLPSELRERIRNGRVLIEESAKWRHWLTESAKLVPQAADMVLKGQSRYPLQPSAETLVKFLKGDLRPWQGILGDQVRTSASVILGKALEIYGLPRGSQIFVKDAWDRWH